MITKLAKNLISLDNDHGVELANLSCIFSYRFDENGFYLCEVTDGKLLLGSTSLTAVCKKFFSGVNCWPMLSAGLGLRLANSKSVPSANVYRIMLISSGVSCGFKRVSRLA